MYHHTAEAMVEKVNTVIVYKSELESIQKAVAIILKHREFMPNIFDYEVF